MFQSSILALALAVGSMPTIDSATKSFAVNGNTAWFDYQVQSEALPSGCRIWVTREKGADGEPNAMMTKIDLARGQSITFQEGMGLDTKDVDKVVVHCNSNNKVTTDGPPPR